MNVYWVLIYCLWMAQGGGCTTAEFTSKERCDAAVEQLNKSARYGISVGAYVCTLK